MILLPLALIPFVFSSDNVPLMILFGLGWWWWCGFCTRETRR
jgi:hypothetical protein